MSQKDYRRPIRDLPKSLQGIEVILRYLYNNNAVSIRNISDYTGISMRVAKNILLQLEKFNQVERVIEKNYILPKWRITKFGKKVVNQAKNLEEPLEFQSREAQLLLNIKVPSNIEKLKLENDNLQEKIILKLGDLQNDISKTLGLVLNFNNPKFEDLISQIIKRIRYLKQRMSSIPIDPIESYKIKKIGEKKKSVAKEEIKLIHAEIFFFNSLILNEIEILSEFERRLSQSIENNAVSKGYTVTFDFREELRVLTTLIHYRESIKVYFHILSKENLRKILKNQIDSDILDNIIDIHVDKESQLERIEEIFTLILRRLEKGEKLIDKSSLEINENIPLFEFYQLILDKAPELNITIEKLEDVINSLADKGIIPGLKIIQADENHYIKVVQLKAHDISKDENMIISHALKLQKFTLADMIDVSGLPTETVNEILNNLTELGILKFSKSYLHGDRWYIISDRDYNE